MTEATTRAALPTRTEEVSSTRRGRWIGVFLTAWLLSAALSAWLATLPGYAGDVSHYKYWTRVVTTEGIQSIYGGEYPETYAIYPPVTLYAYGLVGRVYQRFAENPWETERMLASERFSSLIKGVAVGFHLALGLVVFGIGWALFGVRWGSLAASAYLLNPAVIFDAAYWGQPDAAHSLFVVAALGLALHGPWQGSWAALAIAAMTKPQAWALMPLYAMLQLRRTGLVRAMLGTLIAGLVVLLVLLPFLATGRLGEFFTLPNRIAGVMPVASANAHNLWWIVTGVPLPVVLDSERVIGPLTYRQAAIPLVLSVAAFTIWRYWRAPDTSVFLLAAFQAFGWFCFTTQAHENHPFMVVPLLLLAAPVAPAARVLAVLVTITFFSNMALHDPVLIEHVPALLPDGPRYRLQVLNSCANLGILAGWAAVLQWRPELCGGAARHRRSA